MKKFILLLKEFLTILKGNTRTLSLMATGGTTACVSSDMGDSTEDSVNLTKSVYKNGRFENPWPSFHLPAFSDLIKFATTVKNNTNLPSSKQELDLKLPVVKLDVEEVKKIPESGIRVTWIGHATVLVQFDGVSVLTDPIFSQRCSMSQMFGPKRFRDPPCSVEELPEINAVVISHSHYDHLDYNTVVALNKRFGGDLRWFVPFGLKDWLMKSGCKNVVELDWWQKEELHDRAGIEFVCVPCQHWSNRGLHDICKTLWSGWVIKGPSRTFYFAGDTGYCDVFKEIGQMYGPIDLAAIPIGAYEPRWFMECQHVDPEQAVDIHRDVQAKKSIGVHWGTFALAREFYLEPPRKLRESLKAKDLPEDSFFVTHHGESKLLL